METKGTFYKDIFELKELGKDEYQIIYTPRILMLLNYLIRFGIVYP